MNVARLVGLAVLQSILLVPAFGQDATAPPAAPSDVPVTAAALPEAYQPDAAPADEGPKPWKMPQPRVFQHLGIDMGGWIQQGITFNPDRPADGFNGPMCINDRVNEYQLNQAWLYLVRPTKTDGCGWDIGGRVDMVWGTDWRFGQNYGLEDRINGNDNFYGWVFPQMYLEVAYNDLTVKLGHFATFTSYEVVPSPLNFFYSHTYSMSGYFDPLLVTGALTEYKLNDNWTAVNGFHRGPFMWNDINNDLNYLGGVKYASDDKRTNVSLMVDTGDYDPAGNLNRTGVYMVYSYKLNDKLNYAIQGTVGADEGGAPSGETAQWYGIAQWLTWKINDRWSAGARFEGMRDDDGTKIYGIGNVLGSDKGWLAPPGFAGNFYDMTVGLNWRPNANIVFRPEVRWDWYDGVGDLPFDNGAESNQFTAAMDLIVTF